MQHFTRRLKSIPVLAVLTAILVAAVAFPMTARSVSAIGPPGATIYENTNFNNDPKNPGGKSLTTTEDIACLQDAPFKFPKKTKSLKVVPGTIVILYQKCGFKGNASAFVEHDSNVGRGGDDDNYGGGGNVSSIRIIPDDLSLGNDHKGLLARLNAIEGQLNTRIDAFQNQLNIRVNSLEKTLTIGAFGNTAAILDDAAANKNTLLKDAKDNTTKLLDDAAANKADLLADAAANKADLLAAAIANRDLVLAELAILLDRIGTPDGTLADTDLSGQIASIYGHANPDPFEVTLQTCIDLGAEVGISGALAFETEGEMKGNFGVDAYGNGATVAITGGVSGTLEGHLSGALGINTEACYEGVRVLFDGTHSTAENSLIASYESAATSLQSGLIGTITAIGLAVDSVVSAVDAVNDLASDNAFDLTAPGSIVASDGPFATLLLSLPMSDQLDIDFNAALTAITTPCATGGLIRDLGSVGATICDAVDEGLAAVIEGIEDTVDFVEETVDGISSAVTSLATSISTFAEDTLNDTIDDVNFAIKVVNDAFTTVCGGYNSGITAISGLTLSLGSITIPIIDKTISLGSISPFSFLSSLTVSCPTIPKISSVTF